MGWRPLAEGAYLHMGAKDSPQAEQVMHVVGIPDLATGWVERAFADLIEFQEQKNLSR